MEKIIAEFRQAVEEHISTELSSRSWLGDTPALPELDDFLFPARQLLSQGKRTRALFLAAGWELYTGDSTSLPVQGGAALEIYQASALVHDDIVDAATRRRGLPTAHISMQKQHENSNLQGESRAYGKKSALLLGDFLLSLAGCAFEKAEHNSPAAFAAARRTFHEMTAEVAYGQYLDNRAEYTPLGAGKSAAITQALAVLYHKSARYSVEIPLRLGAQLAGADSEFLQQISNLGIPLGQAFQLRDDALGLFGKDAVMGKAAGGDITEGKRTVLLAMIREMTDSDSRRIIDNYLGTPLQESDLAAIQGIAKECGAYARHEDLIAEKEATAAQELEKLPADSKILRYLLTALAGRKF